MDFLYNLYCVYCIYIYSFLDELSLQRLDEREPKNTLFEESVSQVLFQGIKIDVNQETSIGMK